MIRRLFAAVLTVLLPTGGTCALLVHVHADGDAEHHQSAPHAHLPGPAGAPHGTAFDHQDDGRAIAPLVFAAVAPDPFDAPALPPPAIVLVVPPEGVADGAPRVTHGHDPPFTLLLPPRAPPFFS